MTWRATESIGVARTITPRDSLTPALRPLIEALIEDGELDSAGYFTMGAEDMAYMQEKVPGCYFFVGSANQERGLNYGHHHPKFDFDERAMITGVALMASAAVDLLKGN